MVEQELDQETDELMDLAERVGFLDKTIKTLSGGDSIEETTEQSVGSPMNNGNVIRSPNNNRLNLKVNVDTALSKLRNKN